MLPPDHPYCAQWLCTDVGARLLSAGKTMFPIRAKAETVKEVAVPESYLKQEGGAPPTSEMQR